MIHSVLSSLTVLSSLRGAIRMSRLFFALCCVALPALSFAAFASPQASGTATQPASGTISLAAYQARLQSLDQLVAACQNAMTPANCQSSQVGPDIQLALPSGPRVIRFAWLRALLDNAAKNPPAGKTAESQKPAEPQKPESGNKPPSQPAAGTAKNTSSTPAPHKRPPEFHAPSLPVQLDDARKRIAADSLAAGQVTAQAASSQAPTSGNALGNPSQAISPHQRLSQILAAKEYHAAVAPPSLRERLLEKVSHWIRLFLAKLREVGSRSKWIGAASEIGFVLLICLALVWFLIRLERQGRFDPTHLLSGSDAEAVSARDWQLWLADARVAAAQGAWRDAIHLVYWASISRLESNGQWPADRARTPREYLALLPAQSPHRNGLSILTRSFERTWYAGRAAAETDFHEAEELAAQLGVSAKARDAAKTRDVARPR